MSLDSAQAMAEEESVLSGEEKTAMMEELESIIDEGQAKEAQKKAPTALRYSADGLTTVTATKRDLTTLKGEALSSRGNPCHISKPQTISMDSESYQDPGVGSSQIPDSAQGYGPIQRAKSPAIPIHDITNSGVGNDPKGGQMENQEQQNMSTFWRPSGSAVAEPYANVPSPETGEPDFRSPEPKKVKGNEFSEEGHKQWEEAYAKSRKEEDMRWQQARKQEEEERAKVLHQERMNQVFPGAPQGPNTIRHPHHPGGPGNTASPPKQFLQQTIAAREQELVEKDAVIANLKMTLESQHNNTTQAIQDQQATWSQQADLAYQTQVAALQEEAKDYAERIRKEAQEKWEAAQEAQKQILRQAEQAILKRNKEAEEAEIRSKEEYSKLMQEAVVQFEKKESEIREKEEEVRTITRAATQEIAKRDEMLQLQQQYTSASAEDVQKWQNHLQLVTQEAERRFKDQFDQFHLKQEAERQEYESLLTTAKQRHKMAQQQIQVVQEQLQLAIIARQDAERFSQIGGTQENASMMNNLKNELQVTHDQLDDQIAQRQKAQSEWLSERTQHSLLQSKNQDMQRENEALRSLNKDMESRITFLESEMKNKRDSSLSGEHAAEMAKLKSLLIETQEAMEKLKMQMQTEERDHRVQMENLMRMLKEEQQKVKDAVFDMTSGENLEDMTGYYYCEEDDSWYPYEDGGEGEEEEPQGNPASETGQPGQSAQDEERTASAETEASPTVNQAGEPDSLQYKQIYFPQDFPYPGKFTEAATVSLPDIPTDGNKSRLPWLMKCKTAIQAASGRPELAEIWFNEIDKALSVTALGNSGVFSALDFKISTEMDHKLKGEFKKIVDLQNLEMHTGAGKSLNGRQKIWLVLDRLKNDSVADKLVKDAEDLHSVHLKNDNLQGFQTAWKKMLHLITERPTNTYLYVLYVR